MFSSTWTVASRRNKMRSHRSKHPQMPTMGRPTRAIALLALVITVASSSTFAVTPSHAVRVIKPSRAPSVAGPTGDVKPLTTDDFDDVALATSPSTGKAVDNVIVEFYMPWCGHCQHFAPEYAKAAEAIRDGVAAFAVDCVENGALCSTFGARSFPYVLMGTPRAFVGRDKEALKAYPRDRKHKAVSVVKWVDETLGTRFADGRVGEQIALEGRRSDERAMIAGQKSTGNVGQAPGSSLNLAKTAHLADLERATTEMYAQMTSEAVFVASAEARDAFIGFLNLAAKAHPIETCHRGLTNVLNSIDERWPANGRNTTGEIRAAISLDVRVCGAARGDDITIVPKWVECAGSVEGLRGYTCGVWTLLHALAARVPGVVDLSNADFILAIEGWVRHFFPCEECRSHFLSMIASKEQGFDDYTGRADGASMWLWKAHNVVNSRLAREESEEATLDVRAGGVRGKHDPQHPKIQFPPASLCPQCYEAVSGGEDGWNEIHVSEFLTTYYLGGGARHMPDLKAATKHAEFLEPFVDASSSTHRGDSFLRKALNSGDDIITFYDVFAMSARFFFMFAFIIVMAVKADVMALFHNRKRTRKARSPQVAARMHFPVDDKDA